MKRIRTRKELFRCSSLKERSGNKNNKNNETKRLFGFVVLLFGKKKGKKEWKNGKKKRKKARQNKTGKERENERRATRKEKSNQ